MIFPEEVDPPPAPSPGPFVLGIQRQGPSWATLHHTTAGEVGGHFPGYRKRPECYNKGRYSRTRATTPTSTGWDFRPSHSSGMLRVPTTPPPGPATRDGQVTSIWDTEATNYQERHTDDGDEHSVQPPSDKDRSPGRKDGGEEQGTQTDDQATSHQEEVRLLDTLHRGAYRPVQEGAGRNRRPPSSLGVGQERGYWEEPLPREPSRTRSTPSAGREEGRAAGRRPRPPLPRGAEGGGGAFLRPGGGPQWCCQVPHMRKGDLV